MLQSIDLCTCLLLTIFVLEDTVKPQFSSWAMNFVPDWQFGFVPGSGTDDYDDALTLKIQHCTPNTSEIKPVCLLFQTGLNAVEMCLNRFGFGACEQVALFKLV